MMHKANLPIWLDVAEQGNPSILAEHHINSDLPGKRMLHVRSASMAATVGSSCSLGSLSLRNCLDLLVKVQKTQGESLDVLTSLRERLFPLATSKSSRDDRPPRAVVTHDEVDRELVRLRILEVKHSDLNLKLSDSISTLMHPFKSFFRSEVTKETVAGDAMEKSGSLWDSFARVSFLHEQFMGLAHLEVEALQALSKQLSKLFVPPTGSVAPHSHYYYYSHPFPAQDEAHHMSRGHSSDTHAVVLRFLLEVEDVMGSKQQIVVCLAMALRVIYDPAAPDSTCTRPLMGWNGFPRVVRGDNSATSLSVSVSPATTTCPSCSAAREESLLSATRGDRDSLPLTPSIPEHVQEFQHDGEPGPGCARADSASPSPKACETVITDTTGVALRDTQSGGADEQLQPSYYRDVSLASGIPRSPSLCAYGVDMVSEACQVSSPPLPLAWCMQQEEQVHKVRQQVQRQHDKNLETNCDEDVSEKDKEMVHVEETGSIQEQLNLVCKEERKWESRDDFDLAAENLRLHKMVEAKDNIILNMQERLLLAAEPQLADSGDKKRGCSCSTRPSCCGRSEEEVQPSGNTSVTSGPNQTLRPNHDTSPPLLTPLSESSAASRELRHLCEQIAAHRRDNHHLQNLLGALKEEKQHWKRAARDLKDENKIWREKERVSQARCEQLENEVVRLKKRLLTAEGALMLQRAVSSPQAIPRGGEGIVATSPVKGIPSTTRSRSRTQPPPTSDEVAPVRTSASLRHKRVQLLAKLGRRLENELHGQSKLPERTQASVFDDEPVVVVSPLTEERVPRDGSIAPVPSSLHPGDCVDRCLSSEYRVPEEGCHSSFNSERSSSNDGNGGGSTGLSTQDVSRILASARSLLRTLGSTRRGHNHVPLKKVNSPHLVYSDCSSSSNKDKHHDVGAVPMGGNLPLLRRFTSPPNDAASPCSSVSYSSARKRTQRLCHSDRDDADVKAGGVTAEASSLSTSSLPLPLPPLLSPQKRAGNVMTSSPPSSVADQPRRPTAREALMRELRDQLHMLQGQYTGVIHQEEQLRLKRKQVIAAIQGSGGGSDNNGYNRLESLLQRFDTTQAKLRENKSRLSDYVNIVKRQLQTLEDDLL